MVRCLTGLGAMAISSSSIKEDKLTVREPPVLRKSRPRSVIVIGAGVSGLVAAQTLHKSGIDVIVHEARERIGGRIFTDRQFSSPVELGATWLHGGPGNPLKELIEKTDLETVVYDPTQFLLVTQSGQLARPMANRHRINRALSQSLAFGVIKAKLFKRAPSVRDVLAAAKLWPFALSRKERDSVFELVETYLEAPLAGSLSTASSLELTVDSNTGSAGTPIPGDEEMVLSGLDGWVKTLAEGLMILTRSQVEKIAWNANSASVHLADGKTEKADAVICTVPLGVLKTRGIHFEPALPQAVLHSIERLGMGTLNKVVLEFPDRAWMPKDEFVALERPARASPVGFFVNLSAYGSSHIWIGLLSGRAAAEAERKSNQELASLAMRDLRFAFGNGIPDPIRVSASRWASDPFSCGSYSGYPLGSHRSDRETLARPFSETLQLAGEALDPTDYGTLHAAYRSGLKAAANLLTPR